ncbi:MAG: putative toxin-antitoxin system toxin component, PIN family [Gammaproteobacteria bacterium]|nr:putative toxin-antitoxin system toxin component, PIN family [Gammaproteobacteria bacterium]
MIITLDTNALLAALLNKAGASHLILKLIVKENLRIALTTSVALEYEDVLKRDSLAKKLNLSHEQIEEIIDLLILLAEKHSIYYRLRPNLLDEKDDLFIECAFASNSQYLITSNIKYFKQGDLQNHPFQAITPGDFYYLWRRKNE